MNLPSGVRMIRLWPGWPRRSPALAAAREWQALVASSAPPIERRTGKRGITTLTRWRQKQKRRERRQLRAAIVASLVLHTGLLLLQFDDEGLGLPGRGRSVRASEGAEGTLHVRLMPSGNGAYAPTSSARAATDGKRRDADSEVASLASRASNMAPAGTGMPSTSAGVVGDAPRASTDGVLAANPLVATPRKGNASSRTGRIAASRAMRSASPDEGSVDGAAHEGRRVIALDIFRQGSFSVPPASVDSNRHALAMGDAPVAPSPAAGPRSRDSHAARIQGAKANHAGRAQAIAGVADRWRRPMRRPPLRSTQRCSSRSRPNESRWRASGKRKRFASNSSPWPTSSGVQRPSFRSSSAAKRHNSKLPASRPQGSRPPGSRPNGSKRSASKQPASKRRQRVFRLAGRGGSTRAGPTGDRSPGAGAPRGHAGAGGT